jgi:hypothetical protein
MHEFDLESIPQRFGPSPKTTSVVPHRQLDQYPPPELIRVLVQQSLTLEQVRPKESRLAAPDTVALCVPDELAKGPESAFIDDHEFCHVHAPPDGSIHLTLPPDVAPAIMKLGWAEQHAIARAGILPETILLVYAPRNSLEVEVVSRIIEASYWFARGNLTLASADG